MLLPKKKSQFPVAIDKSKVGTYPAAVKLGGGYFYDDVLEYRVWVHPIGEDVFFEAFATYEDALRFTTKARKGEFESTAAINQVEDPLVLVWQAEHVNEPQPGKYIHAREPRVAEWKVEWLANNKGSKEQIPTFLATHQIK